jgi:hypothetical protein
MICIQRFCSYSAFALVCTFAFPQMSSAAFFMPPFAGAVADGNGGRFVVYQHLRAVRLQHIDAQGHIWPASKLLIESPLPIVLQCMDPKGRIWVLSYNQQAEEIQTLVYIQCFDAAGRRLFENEGVELEIRGTPEIRFDSSGQLVIHTSPRDIWIDETGDLSFPTGTSTIHGAVFQEIPVHESLLAPILFQVARDQRFLELSTYLSPDEIREVEIYVESSTGQQLYHFEGFMDGDFHNWLIGIEAWPTGAYHLSMRVGDMEQVEEIQVP